MKTEKWNLKFSQIIWTTFWNIFSCQTFDGNTKEMLKEKIEFYFRAQIILLLDFHLRSKIFWSDIYKTIGKFFLVKNTLLTLLFCAWCPKTFQWEAQSSVVTPYIYQLFVLRTSSRKNWVILFSNDTLWGIEHSPNPRKLKIWKSSKGAQTEW